MKILVTGGCGFIGGHLCELLVKKGHEVTVLDDLSTGSLANVASLKGNKKFSFKKGTICNARLVDRLVRDADAVFHLASVVGVKLVCDEPVRAPAPGQAAALYCGDRLLGGGTITPPEKVSQN